MIVYPNPKGYLLPHIFCKFGNGYVLMDYRYLPKHLQNISSQFGTDLNKLQILRPIYKNQLIFGFWP
jgi:hypothetical protein